MFLPSKQRRGRAHQPGVSGGQRDKTAESWSRQVASSPWAWASPPFQLAPPYSVCALAKPFTPLPTAAHPHPDRDPCSRGLSLAGSAFHRHSVNAELISS